jgi:hypothetical protein
MPTTYIFICNRKPPDQPGQVYNVHTYFSLEKDMVVGGGGGGACIPWKGRELYP